MLFAVQRECAEALLCWSEVANRNLSIVVGHSKRDELARPGPLSAHFLNHES